MQRAFLHLRKSARTCQMASSSNVQKSDSYIGVYAAVRRGAMPSPTSEAGSWSMGPEGVAVWPVITVSERGGIWTGPTRSRWLDQRMAQQNCLESSAWASLDRAPALIQESRRPRTGRWVRLRVHGTPAAGPRERAARRHGQRASNLVAWSQLSVTQGGNREIQDVR